jgi:hypothetical protein
VEEEEREMCLIEFFEDEEDVEGEGVISSYGRY